MLIFLIYLSTQIAKFFWPISGPHLTCSSGPHTAWNDGTWAVRSCLPKVGHNQAITMPDVNQKQAKQTSTQPNVGHCTLLFWPKYGMGRWHMGGPQLFARSGPQPNQHSAKCQPRRDQINQHSPKCGPPLYIFILAHIPLGMMARMWSTVVCQRWATTKPTQCQMSAKKETK